MIRHLIAAKLYLTRTVAWFSMIRYGMLVYVMVETTGLTGWHAAGVMGATVVGLITLGWMEDRLGLINGEHRWNGDRNPYLREIVERLDRIEKRIG